MSDHITVEAKLAATQTATEPYPMRSFYTELQELCRKYDARLSVYDGCWLAIAVGHQYAVTQRFSANGGECDPKAVENV